MIKGFNYKKVKSLAESFRNIINRNPRIDNVDIDRSPIYWEKDSYEIIAEVDRSMLARFNIPIVHLLNTIAKNSIGNLASTRYRIENEEVAYNIKFSNYPDIQLEELENLIIQNTGEKFKVKDMINFEERKVLSSINREDQQYIRQVSFNYKGPYKYGNKFVETSIEKMIIPEGYSINKREYSWSFGEKDEVDIWIILAIAVLLIFMITASLFESLRKPFFIILAVPFAMIGVMVLFYWGEYNLDRGAYAGLLLLVGLAVNNSILLVDYFTRSTSFLNFENIIKLSYSRIRPIFTTSVTTIAALTPLLLTSESSFWKSLSLSVIGGILLSAIMVVVFVPLFYFWVERKLN